MARTEAVGDVAVVLRALVGVLDQELDRGAGRHPIEDAAQDAHLIGFLPLGGIARLAGLALVEPVLDVGLGERQARRHAVDDDPDRRPVALAPSGEAKERAERIAGHRLHHGDVRGIDGLHADDVIAAIDVVDLAADTGREIAQQIKRRRRRRPRS